MRLSKQHGHSLMKMNMTPMMDVTFLLLIFFMTATQMSESSREQMNLPKLPGSEDRQMTGLTINVTEKGQLIMNGNPLTLNDVVGQIGQALAGLGNDPSRLQIEIRADERGESRGVNDLVEALVKLQVKKIRIGVQVPR